MASINLKGREVPLLYTTYEMKEIMDNIGPISEAIAIAGGRNPKDPEDESTEFFGSAEHISAQAKLIRVLGNAGLEEAGEAPDLTDKKVMRALKPSRLIEAFNACVAAMAEGMESEFPEEKKAGPVDVVLEEIEKKKIRQTDVPDRGQLGTDRRTEPAGDQPDEAGPGDGSFSIQTKI